MKKILTYGKLVWIDLEAPTKDEIRDMMENFSIHPIVAEELMQPTLRSKVDLYDNLIYLILHFPAKGHTHSLSPNQEIDFIIGKDFLISVHYDTIDAIHKFAKIFESNSITHNTDIGDHAGYIFYLLTKKLYSGVEHELEDFDSKMENISEKMFAGKEKEMVKEISELSQILIDFKRIMRSHNSVLLSLEHVGIKFFGSSFIHYFKRIEGEQYKVTSIIEGLQESIKEIRETNNSMLTTKQNEVMKILTIMAFVTFPLSLLASIFGMNTQHLPFVGNPYDFWVVIGLMFLLAVSFFIFFKKNKWL
ncbi:hypothetical protein COW81_03030 [Candidatus Campbellbacteria bacterium CG22_combo_CG10-13_8_21_14_all_36_13]|uniref:Magnesium transporter CorA n=1 Tax=Candidatus Campbellbacteria bacterium CG22_combo_CG10-13_8_21_14_all_36_13 TaxID=1974529 RepID=A0A2H0DXL7_9BACT|nr:MAG: hypothetical protein COW81_03030 [Candidatus Campbellbacteria bacterium CG22_combo_CG10-13_8_21_14_all_36_13]